MNPKSFPKRLDSKTSCLRITVPENLDLALEGLIRKVLREQPKTDDIYAFAANYFETLLRIRDKAGVEYTATQLCPFHNDEEAREMIVLAGTFPRQVSGRVQGKGSAPLKTETKKETDKAEPEKAVKRSKETSKDSNPEAEKKQAAHDLIKKLPLLDQNQGLKGEEVGEEKTTDVGLDRERIETVKEGGDGEEYLTSDPIKEFVEKELLTEGKCKEKVAEREAPEPSEVSPSPIAREGQNEEAESGAPLVSKVDEKKGADGGDNAGGMAFADGIIHAGEDGGKRKIDPEVRETHENEVEAEDMAKDAKDKIGDAAQAGAGGERPLQETQQKKEKENDESTKLRSEEESQSKAESASERDAEPEGVEAPLPPLPPFPGTAQKHAQEPVDQVSSSYNTAADVSLPLEGGKVMESAASSEAASPQEKGTPEVGGVQQAKGKSETDAQPSTAPPMKAEEESSETSSLVIDSHDSKPVESDDARSAETDRSEKSDRKEATNAAEPIAWGEQAQDLKMEATSGRKEQGINKSPERAKVVQEIKESGASLEEEVLHQTKDEESNKGRENQDTKADDPTIPDLKSTEEGKLTSASAGEAKDPVEQPQTGSEDPVTEPVEEKEIELSGKLDPEILKQEQFSHSQVTGSDTEAEPKRGDEEGNAEGDKKLSNEAAKAKDESLTEGRESPSDQTSPKLLQKAEDLQCAAEAPTEEATDADGSRTLLTGISSPTEGPKNEEQGLEAPRDRSSPTSDAGSLTEPGETPEIATCEAESASPEELKTEDAPAAGNETALLANEELCSVVDINHLKRGGEEEEPKLAEPRPNSTAEEKSAPEHEGSPFPDNRNDQLGFQQESEAEDAIEGKAEFEDLPNAAAVQGPVKSETDKEKGSSAEGTPPETWEGFDPSAEGKQIIIVEEPEATNEDPEESSPPGEIQIKTIQTHYYDALRVPDPVTREYRVHEVLAPTVDGLLGTASPPTSTHGEVQESSPDEERSGRLTDDNAVPLTPKNSPTSDGDFSPYAEAAEAQSYTGPPYDPSHVKADALLAVDGLDRDAQAGDSDDLPRLMTPTSDVASLLSELSLQAASETFLTNEKRFSSLEKEEIRFVTLTADESRNGEPEGQVIESSREIDEGADETAGARPAPQTPGKTEAARESTEGAEHVKEDGERPSHGSSGGSPAVSDGRPANGDPPTDSGSENPVSEPRPQGEDESVLDAARLSSGVKTEDAADVDSADDLLQKIQGRNVLESCPEEAQAGSRCDDRGDGRSSERTSTGNADSDSATSRPATEVKRADSARRDFASGRSLSSARSLDLGKRNPLLRTRSLSTHRRGVADFEVWSTIEKELEEAATKIQSKFRGYNTRKKLRREVAVQISTEESSKRSTPVEADDADNHPRATGEFHDGIVLAEHPR